jgi:hypothetical protein
MGAIQAVAGAILDPIRIPGDARPGVRLSRAFPLFFKDL